AGTSGPGEPCYVSRNHLDPNSHKLISDCSELGCCSGSVNGTCVPRTRRRVEFPFDALPLLCPPGSFCPDEGNGKLVPVGRRDERCVRAVNWQDFTSSDNFHGCTSHPRSDYN
ncbi:hypothetical protein BDP27DRAFT_1268813, partial [Rhodocollybia butyracea]